jgi:hypothetical protein
MTIVSVRAVSMMLPRVAQALPTFSASISNETHSRTHQKLSTVLPDVQYLISKIKTRKVRRYAPSTVEDEEPHRCPKAFRKELIPEARQVRVKSCS